MESPEPRDPVDLATASRPVTLVRMNVDHVGDFISPVVCWVQLSMPNPEHRRWIYTLVFIFLLQHLYGMVS